jgi:hypothetical protein
VCAGGGGGVLHAHAWIGSAGSQTMAIVVNSLSWNNQVEFQSTACGIYG